MYTGKCFYYLYTKSHRSADAKVSHGIIVTRTTHFNEFGFINTNGKFEHATTFTAVACKENKSMKKVNKKII